MFEGSGGDWSLYNFWSGPTHLVYFSIYLGSEVGLWVMTAGVEILLFMGLLGCGIIVLRGLTYFGDTRPVGRGHSQNFFFIFFLYISYMLGVGTTLVGDDCGGLRYRYLWGICMVL